MTATGSRNGRETGVCIFMEVILANPCGFCYGVQRAVRIAEEAADHLPAATLGPLIHNPQVTEELGKKGVLCKERLEEFSPGETIIFRSHGVSPSIYEEAVKKIYKFWTQLARMSK